jgi:integrase
MEVVMARSVRSKIETRSARLRLPARREPYWQTLEPGLAAGYYRPTAGAGSWWARARAGGRYVVEALATADDHADADGERTLNWVQAQVAVRAWAGRQMQAGPLTVGESVEIYLADLQARKGARTARATRQRLAKHLPPVLGAVRLSELTAGAFLQWRNGLVPVSEDEEDVRRGRDSANRTVGMAKAALNLAFASGLVADDRAWRRVRAFGDVGRARRVILTEAEIQRLADACEPGLRELVLMGALTGARLGELTAARARDFDAEAATLGVRGKTGPREIHLPPAAAMLLRQLASGKRPDDHLLAPPGLPCWRGTFHSKRFAAAAARAGLPSAAVYYTLRHSFISRALVRGVPVEAVAQHVGTSGRMIGKHYAKFVRTDARHYAQLASPELRVDGAGAEVVKLRPAG